MRARDIIGKTVAAVEQVHYTEEMGAHGGPFWALDCIRFTDGSSVYFTVIETETESEPVIHYRPPPKVECPVCGGQVQRMHDGELVRHFDTTQKRVEWCAGGRGAKR